MLSLDYCNKTSLMICVVWLFSNKDVSKLTCDLRHFDFTNCVIDQDLGDYYHIKGEFYRCVFTPPHFLVFGPLSSIPFFTVTGLLL